MNLGGGPVFPGLGFSLLVAPLDRVLRQRDLAARGALATRWKRAPLLATKMETSRKTVAVMATRRGKKRGFSLPSGMRPQPPLGVQAVSKVPSPQNHRWPVLIKVACTVLCADSAAKPPSRAPIRFRADSHSGHPNSPRPCPPHRDCAGYLWMSADVPRFGYLFRDCHK